MLNLLSNASKYSPENRTRFKASIKNYSILVEVKDQGIGIVPEDQKNLFMPHGAETGPGYPRTALPVLFRPVIRHEQILLVFRDHPIP